MKFTTLSKITAYCQLRLWLGRLVIMGLTTTLVTTAAGAGDSDLKLGVTGVRGGVVATSEPIATKIGTQILREGGNAVDAAAAVAFALNVVEPQSSGIGGGGFIVIYDAKTKLTTTIDSREEAPAAVTPDMFLLSSNPNNSFAFDIRSTSGIGVGVPGMVRGIEMALNKYGNKSFAEILEPAINLAENGFRVSSRLEDSISSSRLSNEVGNPAYDAARKIWLPNGKPLVEGDFLVQLDLAKTLKMLANKGPEVFYKGEIAEAIVDTQHNARVVANPADQAKLIGRMTLGDLAAYQAIEKEPVEGNYRGFHIASMPPPSSGGLTVIYILKLLEHFPIGDESKGFGFGSVRTLNVMIEAMRLAFQDRARWMGDTDEMLGLPINGLINNAYLAKRAALINADSRRTMVESGDPRSFDTTLVQPTRKVQFAKLLRDDVGGLNTTHFSIVDKDGNVVSYTNTVEATWGTGLLVAGYGFLLNNELTDFNSMPRANDNPDNFDPGANDPAANKRPLSSMSPTIVFRNKKPVAAYGSPGGSTIINTVVNMTLNLIDHERTVQEAIDLPHISHSSSSQMGGVTLYENRFDPKVIADLKKLGHIFFATTLGSVQAVIVAPGNKKQNGIAEKSSIGAVEPLD
jgi:gamma-glutamyltranspeptidase/glutathione hydrolase